MRPFPAQVQSDLGSVAGGKVFHLEADSEKQLEFSPSGILLFTFPLNA